jgi:hypothetical protein
MPAAGAAAIALAIIVGDEFFRRPLALLIEQLKPLPRDNWVHDRLVAWTGWVDRRNFDAGKPRTCLGGVVRFGARPDPAGGAGVPGDRPLLACCWPWPSTSRCCT